MLLCLDVVTGAAVNMARGRFGADSLAVLACVLTSFDALAVALGAFGSPHTPFCLLSSLSLAGVLLSSLLSAEACGQGAAGSRHRQEDLRRHQRSRAQGRGTDAAQVPALLRGLCAADRGGPPG